MHPTGMHSCEMNVIDSLNVDYIKSYRTERTKTRQHSSRMPTVDLPTVLVLVVTTRCQCQWRRSKRASSEQVRIDLK